MPVANFASIIYRQGVVRSVLLVCLCFSVLICAAQAAEIGAKVGNFELTDITGKTQSLQSYSGRVVVLVFWSFKCPVSLAYDDRVEALQNKYGNKGIAVLLVSSNANETASEIRANASNLNLRIPVLLDSDGNLADKFGATHTPSVFILDGNGILRYRGALDNNKRIGDGGRVVYADDALDAILEGRSVAISETKPFGCSIRRKTP